MATLIRDFSFFDYLNFRNYVFYNQDRDMLIYGPSKGYKGKRLYCRRASPDHIFVCSTYVNISNRLSHEEAIELGILLQKEFNKITNNDENTVCFIICSEYENKYPLLVSYTVPSYAEYFIYSDIITNITQKLTDYLKNMCVVHKPLFDDTTLTLDTSD